MKRRFIFYSLATIFLVGLGAGTSHEEFRNFITAFSLWSTPVMAGLLCGLLSGLLGLYMVWNRIVFVSLAITQGAGVGIFLSFFVAGFLGLSLEHSPLSFLSGVLTALLTTFLFVFSRQSKKYSEEVVIGLVYVLASGLIVFIGDRIAEGKHAIDNLLFGNAVAVTSSSFVLLLMTSLVIFGIHFFCRREFLYASADSEFMSTSGMKSKIWTGLLYVTFTIGITISMKILGSLPVFSLMVIPPFIALKGSKNPVEAVLLSLFLGGVIPPLGYYFSFLYSFPTGASMIVVGLFYLLIVW